MDYQKVLSRQKAGDRLTNLGLMICAFAAGFITSKFQLMPALCELIKFIIYGLAAFVVLFMVIVTLIGLSTTTLSKDIDADEQRELNKYEHWNVK